MDGWENGCESDWEGGGRKVGTGNPCKEGEGKKHFTICQQKRTFLVCV